MLILIETISPKGTNIRVGLIIAFAVQAFEAVRI